VTKLTDGPEYEQNLVWSPDGSKLAFERYMRVGVGPEIYVIDADGNHLANLTNHPGWDMWPEWSPDGTQIAFVRQQDGSSSDIYLINADGSNAINLNLPGFELSPRWSIDGSKIYFVSWRDYVTDIYVVNVDDGQVTNLTNDSFDESYFLLSPDGDKLLFGSEETLYTPDGRFNGSRYYLFIMNTSGGEKTQLFNSTNYRLGQAVWAPDGSKVTFVYSDDIYVVEVEE
jgi:Tol biopolymer transport system component